MSLKGCFPHFFNTPKNQDYIGKYPDPESYGSDFMSVEDNKKFMIWYEAQKDKIFNFKNELLEYYKSDVNILTSACLSFRKLFIEITKISSSDSGVDPFLQCITLPAASHYVL